MALTEAEIALVVEEIADLAADSTVQKVLEPAERRIALRLRQTGTTRFLCISTERNATRIHFLDEKPDQPGHPSSFVMLLRKWLHGAPLQRVRQIEGDRIVELSFSVVDPRIDRRERNDDGPPDRMTARLVCELADRVGEVFLLDDEGRIVGRQTGEAIGSRDFRTGETWSPPPPPPNSSAGAELRWELDSMEPASGSRSRAIAAHYRNRRRDQRCERLLEQLESELEKQLERLERRIENVESDLEEVENAELYRRRAELLQSAYGEVEKGAESVEVEDYYAEEMPTVEIPLDPRKSLQENIDDYYHEARRYEEAREFVEERLLTSIDLRDRVRSTLEAFDPDTLPSDPDELEELADEWRSEELLPTRTTPQKTSEGDTSKSSRSYRLFRAKSGRRILVGKGASENDTLTTKIARGRDIWLHARDWSGAHVVLRMHDKGETPEQDDLVDAATLAAHFSKGKNDTVVEVGYTRAKHVRKTGNLPPGRVFVSDEKTVAVELEDGRLERLLETEQ